MTALQTILDGFGPEPDLPPLDPRLASLADGTLSQSDRLRLHTEALSDPTLAEQVEAFTPSSHNTTVLAHQALHAMRRPAPRTRQARSWWPLLASLLAACLLMSAIPASPVPFEVDIVGGDQVLRGKGYTHTVASRGSIMTLYLRPTHPTEGPELITLTARSPGHVQPIPVDVDLGDAGDARVRFTVPPLPGEGPWQLDVSTRIPGHRTGTRRLPLPWRP